MKKLSIALVVIGLIVATVFFLNQETGHSENPTKMSSENIESVSNETSRVVDEHPASRLNRSPEQCEELIKKSHRHWFNHFHTQSSRYFEQYDADILTGAFVLLENPTLAIVQKRRSVEPDKNFQLRELHFPKGAKMNMLSQEYLLSLSMLDREQLNLEVENIGLLINEVMLAINSDKFSEQQVFKLMESLVDINGHGLDFIERHDAIDLLETIVDRRDYSLFKKYLELGGNVRNDAIGVNALERLFVGNGMGVIRFDKPIPKEMIEHLVQLGLPIRGEKVGGEEQKLYLGAYETRQVRKFEEFYDQITKHNLVLSSAPQKSDLETNPAIYAVFQELRAEKNEFMQEKLGVTLEGLRSCKKAIGWAVE